MLSEELQEKKKQYNKLLERYFKADTWFSKQDESYFDNVEAKKEYMAFKEIIKELNRLYSEIEKAS